MKRTLIAMLSLGLLLGAMPLVGSATAASPAVAFGMESASMAAQASAGVKADYGTFWIGPWTLSGGWGGPDNELTNMKNAGVTPAVHFYYWGDDITPSCVENGCWSSLHNAQKTKAGWQQLAQQMTDHFNSKMGGKPVMVFLESEFNKGGIQSYEPFDGYMADMANFIHAKYPAAQVVLGFGNWGASAWGTFDRAAAASDFTGLQGMRGSTHETGAAYSNLYASTLTGVKTLQTLFHKPIVLTDIALSSYPEPGYLTPQKDGLKAFFTNMGELKAAGVQAMIYRSWTDSPGMDLANYYGMAERYWGLASSGGAYKPAAQVWIDGVKAERANAAPAPTPTPTPVPTPTPTTTTTTTPPVPTGPFTATFAPSGGVNEWWVDVKVTSSGAISSVAATTNGVAHNLPKTAWGTWATSFNVPKGTPVVFTAKDASGATATSAAVAWLLPAGTPVTTAPAPAPTPAPVPAGFTASFAPRAVGNGWWVETAVTSGTAISKVEVSIGGGAYTALPKTAWGTYAKSLPVPGGALVVFKATSPTGATAVSPATAWK
ncbi:MAG: hypothetical protein QOG31_1532 [Thermoplasmata archaeon]|nr:hypothetical protein [Thermoplasmata archaeon]